jgi:hypothetical protein
MADCFFQPIECWPLSRAFLAPFFLTYHPSPSIICTECGIRIKKNVIQQMKLTDKEKKSLQAFEGKKGKLAYAIIIFVPIFFAIMSLTNLYLANRIGMHEGHNLLSLFNDWIKGIDINGSYSYSGIYLKAQERFSTALLQLSAAIIAGLFVTVQIRNSKINRKIIELLKKHNEWEE